MYSSIGEGTSMTDYRKISQAKNYTNTLKILEETNIKGHVRLEASFVKNNGIQIRSFFIHPNNIDKVVSDFNKKKFLIVRSQENNTSYLNEMESRVQHPEYINNNMQDFKKQAFNNSFKEKFST
tara:strand:+ start:388 stop:759 length:372 start_codon:yes stop_codon:yes gene_type:complete